MAEEAAEAKLASDSTAALEAQLADQKRTMEASAKAAAEEAASRINGLEEKLRAAGESAASEADAKCSADSADAAAQLKLQEEQLHRQERATDLANTRTQELEIELDQQRLATKNASKIANDLVAELEDKLKACESSQSQGTDRKSTHSLVYSALGVLPVLYCLSTQVIHL